MPNELKMILFGIAAVACAYFAYHMGDIRGEEVLGKIPMGTDTVRLVQEDRKFFPDRLRVEFLDEDGDVYLTSSAKINSVTFEDGNDLVKALERYR